MKSSIRITAVYVIVAGLWILLSDRLIGTFTEDISILTKYSSIKGIFFILITGTLLYLMIQKRMSEKNEIIRKLDRAVEIREQLIKELHHRIKNNMQVVISLINLEAGNIPGLTELNERITNKLLSMMSIFNIVYDIKDMEKISFDLVVNEYVRISIRNLEYKKTAVQGMYSIELITSLMLVIDSVIEVYHSRTSSGERVTISLADTNRIALDFHEDLDEAEVRAEERQFVELQLLAISGAMEIDNSKKALYITFEDSI